MQRIEASWQALTHRTGLRALDLIARWIRAQVDRIGARGCVLGVSGGVDSSLAAVLLARAVPERSRAYLLPCGGDPQDLDDARALLDALQLPYTLIDLRPVLASMTRRLGTVSAAQRRLVQGNLVSRLRNDVLYHEANRTGCLVVGTGDLDETYLGYSSKGTTADLFPITGLHKDEVRALLRVGLAAVDEELALRLSAKPASPGYWKGQDAEDELGMPYTRIGAALDVIIGQCRIEAEGVVPWDEAELLEVLSSTDLRRDEFMRVIDLVMAGHHKAFGSPALWRPEPFAGDATTHRSKSTRRGKARKR
ncbi:MAG: NAD(+) synthase [Pseudomonadota bacterium]